ncbi:MAG: adenylate kinase [Chloroflexota bacterium]
MNIVLLGAPGAGKGTQADIVCKELGLPHLATGDLYREHVAQGTELGREAKSYMDKGQLGPDELTIRMIRDRVREPDCASGCVFDGFPRTTIQAEALDQLLAEQGQSVDSAVYIEVPEEELVKRLSSRRICRRCQTPYHMITSPPKEPGKCDKCGGELYQRSDDKPETVKERLRVFFSQTMPVLDFYEKQKKLVRVDGDREIDTVARDVLRVVGVVRPGAGQ